MPRRTTARGYGDAHSDARGSLESEAETRDRQTWEWPTLPLQSGMARVAYEPGRRPDGACVFQRFVRPTRTLVAALEALRAEAEDYERRRRRALWLVPPLFALPVVGLVVDLGLGMPAWVLTRFAPLFLGAAGLVLWTVTPRPLRRSLLLDVAAREFGRLAVLLLILGAFLSNVSALSGSAWLPLAGFGLLLLLPVVALVAAPGRRVAPLVLARLRAPWAEPPAWRAPLLEMIGLARTLEPLLAPGEPVAGFIDMSGVQHPWKELRLPPRPDLGAHRLFRDEWARLDLELRDGGRLRLRLVETLDQRDARATLALASSLPGTLREPLASRHALVVSFWPALPSVVEGRAPAPRGVARLVLSPRRRLVELPLADRRLDPPALAAALRLLDPELRLGRHWVGA